MTKASQVGPKYKASVSVEVLHEGLGWHKKAKELSPSLPQNVASTFLRSLKLLDTQPGR